MKLFPALKEDADIILDIARSRLGDSPLDQACYDAYLNDVNIRLLALKESNESPAQGYVILRLEGDEAELDEIVIQQSLEGKGIGSQALDEAMAVLKDLGIHVCYLEARSRNVRARRLYERHGFESYRVRKHYYPDDDAVCYRKESLL